MANVGTEVIGHREFPIAVLMKRRFPPPHKPWLGGGWQVVGVVVNGRRVPPAANGQKVREDGEGEYYLWNGLVIRLHKDEAESYYYNLLSENPRVYVITQEDEQGVPQPFLVSASFDEAHAYLEAEHYVEAVPMPPELYQWVENYVLTHYVPEPRTKRRRRNWKQAGDS